MEDIKNMKPDNTELTTKVWNSIQEASMAVNGPAAMFGSENPFLRLDWMREYWLTHSSATSWKPFIVGVFRGEKLASLAGFRVSPSWFGVRFVRFLVDGKADYLGMAGETSQETLNAVLKAVRSLGPHVVIQLTDLAEDSALSGLLESDGAACRIQRRVELYPCPYRTLAGEAAAASKSNRKFQGRIPGYLKRLSAMGEVELRVIDFDRDRGAALAWLPSLFALHDLRHQNRRNSWKDRQNREFLRSYVQRADRSDLLGFLLLLDGQLVAFDLGFRMQNSFCLHIPAFHPAFEKFRLGHITRFLSFQKCAELGFDVYDFSKGDAFAKRVWSNGCRSNYEYVLTLEDSARARAGAKALSAISALMARGRALGVNRRAGRWLEQWYHPGRKAASMGGARDKSYGEKMPLSYSLVAGLPLPHLTSVVDFVFVQGRSSQLEVFWLNEHTLRVSGTEPEDEMVVDLRESSPVARTEFSREPREQSPAATH